jgi:hypothetical protein
MPFTSFLHFCLEDNLSIFNGYLPEKNILLSSSSSGNESSGVYQSFIILTKFLDVRNYMNILMEQGFNLPQRVISHFHSYSDCPIVTQNKSWETEYNEMERFAALNQLSWLMKNSTIKQQYLVRKVNVSYLNFLFHCLRSYSITEPSIIDMIE